MKKVLVLVMAVMVLTLSTGVFAFQNEPEGFRGLKWGDPPTEDMKFLCITPEGMRWYTRPYEKLSIEGISFVTIVYSFYDQPERLMCVNLLSVGKDNYDRLKTICRARFGKETERESNNPYNLRWVGEKTEVVLGYEPTLGGIGGLVLADKVIFGEYLEVDKKEQVEDTKENW